MVYNGESRKTNKIINYNLQKNEISVSSCQKHDLRNVLRVDIYYIMVITIASLTINSKKS